METSIYVDVLMVINYIINTLLILCLAKLAGRNPKRCRIVTAALIGSISSLTIFLPFMGFFSSIISKLVISAVMVRAAFLYINLRVFLKEWFLFFAVSFFFAGAMLGLWMLLKPGGMFYYNGIVYFDISPLSLIAATAAAYALLTLWHRFSKAGRATGSIYTARIFYNGKSVRVTALSDTGNRLYEPFSDTPVMVCALEDIIPLLPSSAVTAILRREYADAGIPVRLIPYRDTGGSGILPAIRSDYVLLEKRSEKLRAESVYIGLATEKISGDNYNAILNPDIVAIKI